MILYEQYNRKVKMNISKYLLLTAITLLPLVSYSAGDYQMLNQAVGLPFFNQDDDWKAAKLETALRRSGIIMRGSRQVRTAVLSRKIVLGVPAIEMKYVSNASGDVTVIDIIYFNKGDSGKARGLDSNIRNAARTLRKKLTELAGKPESGKYGPKKMQNKVDIWKTESAEFLLEFVHGEFTILHIRKPSNDDGNATDNDMASSTRGKDFSVNVKRNNFGDVAIYNIPMVDQGNKGYCVPATVERVFRYYGITGVDMHRIADAANTQRGGGTTIQAMLRAMAPLCREANLKEINCGEVNLSVIKKYIDRGIPLMWPMYVNQQYEKIRLASQTSRQKAIFPEAWKKVIRRYRVPNTGVMHVCLIVGYNEITDEIGVSNSWGDRELVPTWVPVKIARRVSQKSTIVFLPR